jgi:hypothetical protein
MRQIFLSLLLLLLVGCSSKDNTPKTLDNVIGKEDVMTLPEINSRFESLLQSHPELSEVAKTKLKRTIELALTELQSLKDEENKIFQVLIDKSIRHHELSSGELSNQENLQSRIEEIYKRKSSVVTRLIFEIRLLSESDLINDLTERDMYLFMRDFRSLK